MKKITDADVQRITRLMLSMFKKAGPSVSQEDFVAAGLLGLVDAAHKYDPERKGWKVLSRWCAIERARVLLRWAMRTDADVTIGDASATTIDPEPDETDRLCWIVLESVTGAMCRRVAHLSWVEHLSVADIAARLDMKPETVSNHLQNARKQAYKAIALRWTGSSFHRTCGVMAPTYGPDAVSDKRQRHRDRQRSRAVQHQTEKHGSRAAE